MTLPQWNALPVNCQEDLMLDAYENQKKIEINGKEYSVQISAEGNYALTPPGILSLIRSWFR
jgi:hypothetical protein